MLLTQPLPLKNTLLFYGTPQSEIAQNPSRETKSHLIPGDKEIVSYEPNFGSYKLNLGSQELSSGSHEPNPGSYELNSRSYEPSTGSHELKPGSNELNLGSYEPSRLSLANTSFHSFLTPNFNFITSLPEHGRQKTNSYGR